MRADLVHQETEHGKAVVEPPGFGVVQVRYELNGALFRQLPGEGKFPVPQAAMVGAKISDDRQMVEEGNEDRFIQAVKSRDLVSRCTTGRIGEPL